MQRQNQHYVPQRYLREFAIGGVQHLSSKARRSARVWAFDKTKSASFPAKVRDLASESNFYGPPDAGVEDWFTEVEERAWPAFEMARAVDSPTELHKDAREWLAALLAFQSQRTKEHRSLLSAVSAKMAADLASMNPEGPPPPFLNDPIFADPDGSAPALQLRLMRNIPTFIPHYLNLRWLILRNRSGHPFWTSDNPVVLHNSVPSGLMGNLGLMCPGIEVHFPLGPHRVLVLCDWRHFFQLPDVVDADAAQVHQENILQLLSATRYVFAPANDFGAAASYLQGTPGAAARGSRITVR